MPERSKKLADYFDDDKIETIVHAGGHYIPSLTAHKQVVTRFIAKLTLYFGRNPGNID